MDLKKESGPAGTVPTGLRPTIVSVQDFSRVMLAAPKSGSGKTLITCALLDVLKRRGLHVQAFKCGPDYIDPMFHQRVLGVPSVNLDTWFTGKEGTVRLFEDHMTGWQASAGLEKAHECCEEEENDQDADIAVIEGVMGLYDGLGGITEQASSYELASVLGAPVILIVDAGGMGRSMIAEIRGFQSMDRNHLIAGVLLNKTSAAFGKLMAPEIEKSCGIPVFGTFPKEKELQIDSRHLGLKLPSEIADLQKEVRKAGELLEQNVDIDRLLSVAGMKWNHGDAVSRKDFPGTAVSGKPAESLEDSDKHSHIADDKMIDAADLKDQKCPEDQAEGIHVRIAVARDEAFCFYYEDNLRLLEKLGVEVVSFSPIHDAHLPENINGIYLGGGYPELKAAELSANQSMREDIAKAIRGGMPSVAECGGFMYLQEYIEIPHNSNTGSKMQSWSVPDDSGAEAKKIPMVGLIPGGSHYTGKLVRFGYCSVKEHQPHFLPEGQEIRGHEFHYCDSDDNGTDCTAEKPVSGRSWCCIHETDHSFWGYPHLYWPSAAEFAEHFVNCCREFANCLQVKR